MSATSTHMRTCPFCEATCGLSIEVDENAKVVSVRGDEADVLSHGFICPKATGVKHLTDDPDRLRTPLVKQADGSFAEASWDAWPTAPRPCCARPPAGSRHPSRSPTR